MNILLVSKRLGSSACLCLDKGKIVTLGAVVFLLFPAMALYAGYMLGKEGAQVNPDVLAETVNAELIQQRSEILEAKRNAEDNLNALTLRLGKMQAHVIRLDALGQRLTRIGGLDDGEFDFTTAPAQGGPEEATVGAGAIEMPNFMEQLEELAQQLEGRERQLSVLESMLMNRNLRAEVVPAGRPITKGWLSSKYGTRNDPFTGKPTFHKGVDLAGKDGSDIVAVAAGVVTWAGKRYGYGNLVEINHGNGYVTRYGHCKEVLVEVGATVKKGQVVSKMGSTGRSTGPHVHFEVWVDGRTVNPSKYLYASR
ncbi:MAG: M23 family metallopeptidase [Gammaproteobacteria bacterium]|nr:M23 family metallopeptidase [Gammaproteobacteria bacterium]MCW8840090.1 M23 family metallopeptidase [Gammaproteobacteria bacterium]MCW8928069.1 M23 family metallopeptidase [Gammaproteobacteria bacterium]MCW8959742.1 M23 family metallopeptidase [Gammaproteobacteria bacterium]MCW8973889.1 M23 family metallopeptidase [Gammaproteobacteria bacterium]